MKKLIAFFEIPASDFHRAVDFYETVLGMQLPTFECCLLYTSFCRVLFCVCVVTVLRCESRCRFFMYIKRLTHKKRAYKDSKVYRRIYVSPS